MAELHIWMNGQPVGVWGTLRTGTPVLRYDTRWAGSAEGRALSLSLPFTSTLEHRGDAVAAYFDNMLPDSADIRRRLRRRFRARSEEAFDLLSAIGRDCVGAVQLLPPGMTPEGWNRIDAEPLKDADVERILASVTSDAPLGLADADDWRISIAGAQEKTALLWMGGRWYRPRGATPTTHILKLPLGLVGNMRADMRQSVENEWLCAALMREFGIPVAETTMATFSQTLALAVSRFDRRWQGVPAGAEARARFKPPEGAWIARLPQEDFCQALAVPPERKYETDGGPSMPQCLAVLAYSESASVDRATFGLAQLAFWLLAATDGHGKNFSIQHRRGGRFSMAPLYDVLSAWPIVGSGANQLPYQRARLAMSLRGRSRHDRLGHIGIRHWQSLAAACGPGVWDRMHTMAGLAGSALARVESLLPPHFPERVWLPIATGVRRHADQFLEALG